MTHCNGCPFAADCSGPCDLEPVIPIVPKALADMTVAELRVEQAVAIKAGRITRAGWIGKYISAAYAARSVYDELYGDADCPYCDPYALSSDRDVCPACGD